MTATPPKGNAPATPEPDRAIATPRKDTGDSWLLSFLAGTAVSAAAIVAISWWNGYSWRDALLGIGPMAVDGLASPPLVMEGGDPHLRALMRTISVSEANVRYPYAVLYGGGYTDDLSRHPERCIPINAGPNRGNCSTAAGRYQMLDFTWAEKSRLYHPQPGAFLWWKNYSFAPEYQDIVVYRWLADSNAWGMDIAAALRSGQIDRVLRRLSGTWTSLGYGIETNIMSRSLPRAYQQLLADELRKAR